MDSLVKHRLENARERLESAKLLLDAGKYKDSIGRSYYAIFSAVRAVLARDKVDFSKHAGVIAYFQKAYIKTGIFEKKYSKYLQSAFQIRNNCDYDDFFIVSKQDAQEQYHIAEEVCRAIEEYLYGEILEEK
ncbi:MAG: HEPN domain-containing protein [Roseburia sp.]|nr:HEPN domain-containing protein [Roseburia sp.]